jgi:hypothetical protein
VKKTLTVAFVLLCLGLCQTTFAQTPIVTSFTGGGGPFGSFYGTLLPSGDTIGYRFTADANITITDLGIVDDFDGILDSAHQVGLWRDSDQALLASTTVSSADTLFSGFWYAPVAPVELSAGTEYTLGAVYASDDLDSYISGPSSISTDMISGTVGVEPGVGDLGFVYPTVTSAGNLGRIGPNALYVPEPTSVVLCGLGVLFLLGARRRF